MVWINRCWPERPCTPFIPAVRVLTWSIAKGQVWFATHSDRARLARMSCHLCPAAEINLWGGCMANSGALHILSISSAISASNKTRLMFWCDHENSQEKWRKNSGKNIFSPASDFAKLFLAAGVSLSQKNELSRNDEEAIDVTRWSTYEMTHSHCRTRKVSPISETIGLAKIKSPQLPS